MDDVLADDSKVQQHRRGKDRHGLGQASKSVYLAMMGSIVKTYFAEKKKINPKKIFSVAVMPCTAKKCESQRPEHTINGMKTTDLVITTRELAWMIKSY